MTSIGNGETLLNKQLSKIVMLGAALLIAPACTDQANPGSNISLENGSGESHAAVFEVSKWATQNTGTIPFSAEAQSLRTRRHHWLFVQLARGQKDDKQPQDYEARADRLSELKAAIAAQAQAKQWEPIALVPPAVEAEKADDRLDGSWAMAWRKPDGELVLVSGLDADLANPAGNVPLRIDLARSK